MLNVVLCVLNNFDLSNSHKIYITVYEFIPNNNSYNALTNTTLINEYVSVNDLYSKLNWNDQAFINNLNDIVVIIKYY